MKKVNWIVVIAGALVGLAAVLLTALGNPANMGFCIACFLRDIAGACSLHGAAKVQYVRPEIIGLVLGSFIMALVKGEFRAKGGSSPATRFVLGAFVMIGALAFLGCPLRMVIRLGGGDLNALVALVGFVIGIFIGVQFMKRGFSLRRNYTLGVTEGTILPALMVGLLILVVAVVVVLHVFELVGQILLLHPMVRVGVRVLVVLPLRAAGRIGVDILEAAREVAALSRLHVRPGSADALDHAVGLRCGGEQHRRLRQRQLRFGKAELHRGVDAGLDDGDSLRIGHADVLAR